METCPQCGNEYKEIGKHWSKSLSCEYPPLSDHQREITVGLLMGDGNLNRCNKNPRLRVKMISPNYLEYLDSEFDIFGTGVRLRHTAEENAKRTRESGFSPDAEAENYSDVYEWLSRTHPALSEFESWYASGEKVWPTDIELTPTVLKHWYCGDGHWDNRTTNNRIQISMSNEVENTDKVERIFKNVGLPTPNNWKIAERPSGGKICEAHFTVEQSHELWEYMGKPLPDFEYKWPERYH